jgi:putative oxidoreductase
VTMRPRALFLLRLSLGLLMLIWGLDKLVNVGHSIVVAEHFYLGLVTGPALLKGFGLAQIALGLSVILGAGRRWAYPILLVVTGTTMVGVWRSIVDPWGWLLEGTNVLFYPSLIIFAASLVLWAFRTDDTLSIDRRHATSNV